jgi:hypothetical protein
MAGWTAEILTADVYGHLVPGSNRAEVDRLDPVGATVGNLSATDFESAWSTEDAKLLMASGEPPRNRTENPQIKSLLLCQLS